MSESAYQRIKNFLFPAPDSSSEAGVRLGDESIVRGFGQLGFVIDKADVYGLQSFNVMSKLPGDLILGMDF